MAYQDIPAKVLSRLSHRRENPLNSMIPISNPPKPIEANLRNRASSLGILDRLPLELPHEVLRDLDFQSAIRFSRVSAQGRNVLYHFPAYRDVIKHAPHALAALSQTKLLHLHSASKLHNALRAERCATCPEYGAYLFLPTCERCCWPCLYYKPTRQVVPRTFAAKIFALSPKMVQQLPVMFSVPGPYGSTRKGTYKSRRLFSVSAAKELVISIYGSAGNAKEAILRKRSNRQTLDEARYLQAIFSDYTCLDSLMATDEQIERVDLYFGMASIPFPSLTPPGIVEHGLWCKGCEWTWGQDIGRDRLPAYVISSIVPTNCHPGRVLYGMMNRAYSRIGFFAHIRHCYGAQQLLAGPGVQEG
ncbi:F-box domain-containing protein [Xylaria venustula]|nr:F-box domain-containing protein [Xylaria venustula]